MTEPTLLADAPEFDALKARFDQRAAEWESLSDDEQQRRIAAHKDEIERQTELEQRAEIAKRLQQMPPRFADCTIELPELRSWCDGILATPSGSDVKGLVIVGPTGVGKSGNLWGVYRYLVENGFSRDIRVANAASFISQQRFGGHDDPRAEFDRIARVAVLGLDDLGTHKQSEFTEERLYELVNIRYELCLPTLYTSNVYDLGNLLGDRIASRLVETCDMVEMAGQDRRRK